MSNYEMYTCFAVVSYLFSQIEVQGEYLERINHYIFLGKKINFEKEIAAEIKRRIHAV